MRAIYRCNVMKLLMLLNEILIRRVMSGDAGKTAVFTVRNPAAYRRVRYEPFFIINANLRSRGLRGAAW